MQKVVADVQILDKDWVAKSKPLFWLVQKLHHFLDFQASEPNRPVWKEKKPNQTEKVGLSRFSILFGSKILKNNNFDLVIYFDPKPNWTENIQPYLGLVCLPYSRCLGLTMIVRPK